MLNFRRVTFVENTVQYTHYVLEEEFSILRRHIKTYSFGKVPWYTARSWDGRLNGFFRGRVPSLMLLCPTYKAPAGYTVLSRVWTQTLSGLLKGDSATSDSHPVSLKGHVRLCEHEVNSVDL